MASGKKRHLQLLILFGLIISLCATGESLPNIQIRRALDLQSGNVLDGTILLTGQISSSESHTGFRLMCGNKTEVIQPIRCTISSQNNAEHLLRIRLITTEGRFDNENDGSMIIYTKNNSISFRIEADGNQKIFADTWMLNLKASIVN